MAKSKEPWVYLTLPAIERKPKNVVRVDGFHVAIPLTDRQLADLGTIFSLIKTGGDLSPYYRRSGDRRGDRLLVERGIMHLHLGGPSSDALLYLVQFSDDVLLLGVDTHIHLEDVPPGKKLPGHPIAGFATRLKEKSEARAEMIRASLRKRRSKEE